MKIQQGTLIPPYPHIEGKAIPFPCYAEVKLDGEANIYSCGQLISKASGKIRTDCPITELLKQIIPDDVIVFGELHWADGKAGALYDFLSHATDDLLNFTIFDIHYPCDDNQDYEDRREWMIANILSKSIWKQGTAIQQVRLTRPIYLQDKAELDELVEDNKAFGWEGVVLKAPNSLLYAKGYGLMPQQHWVKIKHRYTMDCKVRQIDPTLERMDVEVPMPNAVNVKPYGDMVRMVGVKLVDKYKVFVKVGDHVEIEHMGQLTQGGLRHPVFRGKVIPKGAKGQYDFSDVSKQFK